MNNYPHLPLLLCLLLTLSACGAGKPVSTDAVSTGGMSIHKLYELFQSDPEKAAALLLDKGVRLEGTVTKVSEWKYYEPRNQRDEILRYAVILSDEREGRRESILCTFHISQKEAVEMLTEGNRIKVFGKIVMLPKAKYPCLDFCRVLES